MGKNNQGGLEMKHPYTVGLELGWKDDALNEEGFSLLTRLSKIFGMEAQERENLEMTYMESLPLISQGIGEGSVELKNYVENLEEWWYHEKFSAENCAHFIGRKALDVGMTKKGWVSASSWMKNVGLGEHFARGAWMQGNEPIEIDEIPTFFDDVVSMLEI